MTSTDKKELGAILFMLGFFLLVVIGTAAVPLIGHPHLDYNRAFGLIASAGAALIMAAGIALRMAA